MQVRITVKVNKQSIFLGCRHITVIPYSALIQILGIIIWYELEEPILILFLDFKYTVSFKFSCHWRSLHGVLY